jgi:predicted alpha-1,2-mannosidase
MQIMNMGNYAHGNQPVQHMIYMYNYSGEPWKAQYWLRETMTRMYNSNPDGYCGDEDNGQTSAWYVFTAMGFYPVCPGSNEYVMGTPYFKKMTVHLPKGKKLVVNAPENSDANRYVEQLKVNGKNYERNYVKHKDLLKGMTMNYVMSSTPNTERGTSPKDAPYSFSKEK